MSKLAYLKATRGQAGALPILGAIASFIPKAVKVVGGALGLVKKASPAAKAIVGGVASGAAASAAAAALMGGGKRSGGASGSFGAPHKHRGITATELRGFNKVAGLLHRVGMVPRKTRGIKHH